MLKYYSSNITIIYFKGKFMLKGKVAIVTGGTRGIGLEIVRVYKVNGAELVLIVSSEETVDKDVNQLAK